MSLDTKNQSQLHKARQIQLDRSTHYIEQFLLSINTLSDRLSSSCPTCGYIADAPLFTKNTGLYCFCPHCKHIYLANPFTEDKLLDFYSGYPTSSLEWHHNEADFYKEIYIKGLKLFQPSFPHAQSILDIGCSSGYFLSIAKDFGYETFGIEPNKQEVKSALDKGISILGATIDTLNERTFDIITLWDVLEHINNPVEYLKRLSRHLSPSGLIFLQVPTCDSLAARVMRKDCKMFDGIEHLTLFSSRSLDVAFSKAGFHSVSKQTVISESYAIQNYLSYEQNPYFPSTQDSFSTPLLLPDSIETSGLGYKIQGVYKPSK